jgi:beta-glucosidase/6-phospho-beta-glucosidase/beta-galactosidase
VPDWVGGFYNTDWPPHFAEYAKAFAKRYPWIQFYTPVNEIYIAATFSGALGWWNERKTSDRDFVTALKVLCKANVLAMQAILSVMPEDVTFIQSESTEYFHPGGPKARELCDFMNQKRFLSLDLSYGHPVEVRMYRYLLENGMTDKEYDWFERNYIKAKCIMGNDYYVTNEHLVHEDGRIEASGEIFGYYIITQQYYDRYRLPVMHTETNIVEPNSVRWLWKEWANIYRFKQDLFPIVGFTWYSLIDQVDWDTALCENKGNINALGLYDMDRKIRPVGEAYKKLIADWNPVLADESYGLHFRY